MAESPAHRLGQIIGDVLEDAMKPLIKKFAEEHSLYMDSKGPRLARSGLKVSWKDLKGNTHDLDYVLERGGSEQKIGTPVAFIELAWRRYTKHSRNKAQEIQGAILPLVETYKSSAPFKGVILAGVFTSGAIQQLKSLGFCVLYFEYKTIVDAFSSVGVDISFEEDTPTSIFENKIKQWESLSDKQKAIVSKVLRRGGGNEVEEFITALKNAILRTINIVRILPLHGQAYEYGNLDGAINFLKKYDEKNGDGALLRYEVDIRYNNGDEIRGVFNDKITAINFLNNYRV